MTSIRPPRLVFLFLLGCGGTPAAETTTPEPAASASEGRVWGILEEADFRALHELTDEAAPAPRGETIRVADTDAYLSLPEAAPPHAAVIVIHEWWGLNDHIRYWADRLAELGFAALAVDLYGGQVATTPEQAMPLMQAVDEAEATAILVAAHAFLGDDPRVRAERVASLGWCFGGAWSLKAGLAIPELDAVVMYYGHTIDDVEKLRTLRVPLLGVFANRDRAIPPATVDTFEQALGTANVTHRILRYDADHAFANPSSARYDAPAADAAWTEVRSFLEQRLRGSTPTPDAT